MTTLPESSIILDMETTTNREAKMTATYTSEIAFTGRGNAVGFTAAGETVVCQYARKIKTYKVWVDGFSILTDARTRNFGTISEARTYAASLLDEAKSEELAWW